MFTLWPLIIHPTSVTKVAHEHCMVALFAFHEGSFIQRGIREFAYGGTAMPMNIISTFSHPKFCFNFGKSKFSHENDHMVGCFFCSSNCAALAIPRSWFNCNDIHD